MTQQEAVGKSRLYSLPPLNVGTAEVEHINSYVTRLAEAHCVSVGKLSRYEIVPMLKSESLKKDDGANAKIIMHILGNSLVGTCGLAKSWTEALETLTGRSDLRYLGLSLWSEIISGYKLLKKTRTWCAKCFNSWEKSGCIIYEPVIWAIEGIDICATHKTPLASCCPRCGRSSNTISSNAKTGCCFHCLEWLGNGDTVAQETRPLTEAEEWRLGFIQEMIKVTPILSTSPVRSQFFELIQQYWGGLLEKRINERADMPAPNMQRIVREQRTISLETLLRTTFYLETTPSFFFQSITNSGSSFLKEDPQERQITKEAIKLIEKDLQSILDGTRTGIIKARGVRTVARRLGVAEHILRYHFPEECKEIVLLRKNRLNVERVRAIFKRLLDEKAASNLSDIAEVAKVEKTFLYEHFPELCRSFVEDQREKHSLAVHEMLKAKFEEAITHVPPPTIHEFIVQVEVNNMAYLRNKFPEEYQRLIQARKHYIRNKQKAHQEASFAAVFAIVENLYHRGIYPSLRIVTKELGQTLNFSGQTLIAARQAALLSLGIHRIEWGKGRKRKKHL